MDRIWEYGASAAPPPAPSSPSSGYPTAGNPATGTPPTTPGPYWYHMITEELRGVITAAGLAPSHNNLGQLLAALQTMGLRDATDAVKGRVELATAAEVMSGTDNTRAVTPAGLFASLGMCGISTSDYLKIPFRHKTTGAGLQLIIQWGYGMTSTTNGGDSVIPYPITFPGDVLFALAGYNESAAPYNDVTQPVHIVSKNKSTITVRSYTGTSNGVNFMVIGY